METTTRIRPLEIVARENSVMEICASAKALENAGEYEAARDALSALWPRFNERPSVDGISIELQAELLLRAGALVGWLGSSSQVFNSQAFAKDLISESARLFALADAEEKVAEAQTDLAICYWREGAMDEARVWFQEAYSRSSAPANQLRALVNSTIVEISANRPVEALSLLDRAAPLLEITSDDAAVGRYHMQRGIVLRRLGGTENLDLALIENTAARVHFEKANHRRYLARLDNNTGNIFRQLGRYKEALDCLERASRTCAEIGDVGTGAQINETRARVFLAQSRNSDAEQMASLAVSVLTDGGEQSLLAEALEAQGIALARMERHQAALTTLKSAAEISETAGDPEAAGRTFLTLIEELIGFLAPADMRTFYREADRRLGERLTSETASRLRSCARLIIPSFLTESPLGPKVIGSLQDEVLRREGELIEKALEVADGSVTRAARQLGLTHQGLCYIINHRHQKLLGARSQIRIRRKSLIKKDKLKS